ncbi:hypothetical protein AX17_006718 [Amanita inopinata Kibby_2008]|nr:hypothetical protein AX17_006718 [Amanita inopinata Kibby_2008]
MSSQQPTATTATPTLYHRTSNPYESSFGYSRAVRKGPFIAVAGTTSLDPSTQTVLHPESAYHQARQAFAEIVRAVEALGGKSKDIVRIRMFVRLDKDCDGVGRAFKEMVDKNEAAGGPAATMIVGANLVDSAMRVEIEADAIVL